MAVVELPSFVRQDGREKVTGTARYSADLSTPGLLHAAVRMGGVAHARIRGIETTRARALPGVVAIVTQADVPDLRYGTWVRDRTLFASDAIRWEGEVVAIVAATTEAIAREAAALIELDLEPLPPVVDLEAAIAPGAPLVHPGWAGYDGDARIPREGNVGSRHTIVKGDAEAALAAAPVVVRERYVADGSHALPIEPRAITAEWQGDRVTIQTSSQVPYLARTHVASTLGMPEGKVRVIVPHLGGGFGGKCEGHFEPHVAALARVARRPVRLAFDRREEFLAPDHHRERMVIDLATGVDHDGTILARTGRILIDNGAYGADEPYLAQLAAVFAVGPYRVPAVATESLVVYTTTQPTGSVRGPVAPQVTWAVEQHMDVVAERLGIDPLELRRRNILVEGDEGPLRQPIGANGAKAALERAAEMIGWGRPLPADEAIGIATGWWPSFPGPSGAVVKLNADGSGTIVTGAQECGTGSVMALPILAAEVLGMRPEEFTLLYQDTDAGGWDAGASGSQTTFNNGRAVVSAATELRERLLALAAERLEANPADLELADGVARVKGSPEAAIPIPELAAEAQGGRLLIADGSGDPPPVPEVDAGGCVGRLGGESFAAPCYFTQAVRVRVDRATGVVRVLEVAAAHESGTIVNPIGAEGQVLGGIVMGIGQALTEGTQLTPDGRQRNADMLDYKLVTAADAPPMRVEFVQVPDPNAGPRGLKGVAEPPAVPTPGAIANAIARAAGTRIRLLPMTAERVWADLADAEAGR